MKNEIEDKTAMMASARSMDHLDQCACPFCEADGQNLGQSLKAALSSIDRNIELFLDEAEIRGDMRRQESRLRAALEKAPHPLLRHRRGGIFRPFWMIPAVASAVILLIAFTALRPVPPVQVSSRNGFAPVPQPAGNEARSGVVSVSIPGTELKGKGVRPTAPVSRPFATLPVNSGEAGSNALDVSPVELSRHFERAQNLLRSVRNANAEEDSATELAYDKDKARKLLAPNRVFRQFAEVNGDQQVSEILDSLENLLVDVANLSDHPATEEIRGLQDRIRRTEIVATLSLLGNSMASRGAIAE